MHKIEPGSIAEAFVQDCDFLLDAGDYDIYRKDTDQATGIVIYKSNKNFGVYPLDQKTVDMIIHAIDEFKVENDVSKKQYWKNEIDLRIRDISGGF